MDTSKIKTLADLKNSGSKSKTIKDELRDNLINSKKNNIDIFSGIHITYDSVTIGTGKATPIIVSRVIRGFSSSADICAVPAGHIGITI